MKNGYKQTKLQPGVITKSRRFRESSTVSLSIVHKACLSSKKLWRTRISARKLTPFWSSGANHYKRTRIPEIVNPTCFPMDRSPTSRVTSHIEPLLTIYISLSRNTKSADAQPERSQEKVKTPLRELPPVLYLSRLILKVDIIPYLLLPPPQSNLAEEFACDIFGRAKGQGQAQWRRDNALPLYHTTKEQYL